MMLGAVAQTPSKTAAVPASAVQFWTGTGSNQAVIMICWEEEDAASNEYYVAMVWGARWNGTVTMASLMDTLAAYDSRLNISIASSGSYLNDMTYTETGGLTLEGSGGWWMYNVNGIMASAINSQTMANGDFVEWSDMGQFNADTIIFATDPNASNTVTEATIAASEILYWVGTGSNQAILAVNWADTALAWGYRWNGTATVATMMADIAAADPRFSYSASGWLDDIFFNDGTVSLAGTPGNYWGSTKNGVMDAGMGQTLANGDFEKWGDPAAGVIVDSNNYGGPVWYYTYAYPMTIHPVSVPQSNPTVTDAEIAAGDILFWVGHGQNEVVMAVNWADTALAWGYRFSTATATAQQMMDDIAAADPRFSYTGVGYITDINYIDTAAGMTTPLGVTTGNWWWSLLNHAGGWGLSDVLHDGDFYKWGDLSVAVIIDSTDMGSYMDYTYAWPYTIHPVSVPDTTGTPGPVDPQPGQFCGPVGTEGCNAIAADSSAIVAWATGVSVVRGPRNISDPNSQPASTGSESNAIGMATLSNVYDVVSLGDGGTALITFARPIANGEGPDFAVYENGFGDYSLELAFVEVSTDGERFVRFPATCLTQTETQLPNSGQTDPTNINNLAGKFRIGYGTPFDLEELRDSIGINIDSIVYVRIVDVVGSINPQYATYDAYGHIVNDPWPTPFEASGFDLTGVAVLHENMNYVVVPQDAEIAASEIVYWVGEGSNKVVMAVNWADTVLAWGYRFSAASVTAQQMMDDIAAADPRFSYTAEGFVNDINFTDPASGHTFGITPGNYWWSLLNHVGGMGLYDELHDGDFYKWGDLAVAVITDSVWVEYGEYSYWDYTYVWPYAITPVSTPTGVSIEAADITVTAVYPNPTADRVNIDAASAADAALYDLTGRQVAAFRLAKGRNSVDLGQLPAGVYMLRAAGTVVKIVRK